MKKFSIFFLLCSFNLHSFNDQLNEKQNQNSINLRVDSLNSISTINFEYNSFVKLYIDAYLLKDKKLISKMLARSKHYFPIFEQKLDKYNLPLELKYLSVVESSLNTRAKSPSGALGLWQFMYPTAKEYGLRVTSYIDERLDPFKSTEAACKYFIKLYDLFGDWNLVLAAYNGGPGYIQRKMIATGHDNYWDLRPHLRTETRNYVPKFIATTYLMEFHTNYKFPIDTLDIILLNTDTIKIDYQTNYKTLSKLTCLSEEDISYYNPSFKNNIIPKGSTIVLPKNNIDDYYLNYQEYKVFTEAVDDKEILLDETLINYSVVSGDYLGKIAVNYNLKIYQIQNWNNLKSTKLNIGDNLFLYVSDDHLKKINDVKPSNKSYTVQKGDTLWDIAKMYTGVSVSRIKKLNKLKSNNLKPGSKLIIPKI
ncbi:LysM peptidoglycan-binding domain-containing protein [Flavobacteriales bacterium]|nr:LysM peptidoglycan-binding domain-containing protein [Flavobacteriales bacterium]